MLKNKEGDLDSYGVFYGRPQGADLVMLYTIIRFEREPFCSRGVCVRSLAYLI